MNAVISIVIPVYNAEKYLSQCIESILSQTYQNIEVILVDDGSPDSSGIICDNYAKSDSRIVVIHNSNGGVSSARNSGLDKATGDYVTFVDSDDFIDANYIFALYENAIINGSDLSFCKFAKYTDGKISHQKENLPSVVNLESNESKIDFSKRFFNSKEYIYSSSCRILYKRSVVQNIRFNKKIRIGEDWMFLLNAIFKSSKISCINDVLYFYRTNPSSATQIYLKKYLDNLINVHYELDKLFGASKEGKRILGTYNALLCYHACTNEIKGCKGFRSQNIKEIRNSELYHFFKLRKIFSICHAKKKIKYLIIWILVKSRLV